MDGWVGDAGRASPALGYEAWRPWETAACRGGAVRGSEARGVRALT